MQAGRPAQPSAADSPSSSHPRKGFCEASRAFRFLRCTAARVAPEGVPGQARIHEPRGSAPRERDHRGGDHPVPSRTRQLSPPSPRVLQRKAAGGQGVALAEGAFLCARAAAEAGRARGGIRSPRGPFLRFRACTRKRPSLAFESLVFAYGASLRIASCTVLGSAGVLGDAADRHVEFPLVYYLAIFRYLLLGYWALRGCCSWVYLALES